MLKFRVFKMTLETMRDGQFDYIAEGDFVLENRDSHKIYSAISLNYIARDLVFLQLELAYKLKLPPKDAALVVEFPRTPEIYQPLNGISKINFPLSDEDILKFLRYLTNWRNTHGGSCEV